MNRNILCLTIFPNDSHSIFQQSFFLSPNNRRKQHNKHPWLYNSIHPTARSKWARKSEQQLKQAEQQQLNSG
jgi:hypothetical protein